MSAVLLHSIGDDVYPLIEVKEISKRFGGIQALNNVSMTIEKGDTLALVGENGAGKSTLAKIIAGVQGYDSGELLLEGRRVSFRDTNEAIDSGIGIVLQEFNLVPDLSIAENLYLSDCARGTTKTLLNRKDMRKRALELYSQIGWDLPVDPDILVSNLSVAEQQILEILKGIAYEARLLILDEPTAALSPREVDKLFQLVRRLQKNHGTTVVFVTHKIEEIFELSNRIVVLRDGEKTNDFVTAETTPDELIASMVGREIGDLFSIRKRREPGEILLQAQNVNNGPRCRGCDITVRRGEIVGLSGLVGAGRTEFARAIFGADKLKEGAVSTGSRSQIFRSPRKAIQQGIGMLPENRKSHGLIVNMSIQDNLLLAHYALGSGMILAKREGDRIVRKRVDDLRIRIGEVSDPVDSLSGGNQQKVVFAKWLTLDPDILILDEPTRGIDIGAKYEIYTLIDQLVQEGKGIILISSELPEILALSDRILVMNSGTIVKELDWSEADEEKIIRYASSASTNEVENS
ncbi:hypothetical protein B4O97_14945 [Marispirochaeta aestuarii]|uniref:ABC transporter domain-containing protein n=1 Tax=Marispirochaeta aestuarii TaxID=1963862 RepID=A0A1Y1RW40_9SPIO|nr:hypothetical protein B4O97_14945 [Marispirochaeta aestuarii]